MKSSNENTDVKELPSTPAQQAQVSTQTDNVDADAIESSVSTATYADMATQTNAEEAAMKNEEAEITRDQVISGRNKTFPLTKNNGKSDFNAASEPIIASSTSKSRKRSRVKWEGVDQEMQTDDIGRTGPNDENQSRQDRRSTVKSDPKVADRSPPFPFLIKDS